jgi:hypothetical protein
MRSLLILQQEIVAALDQTLSESAALSELRENLAGRIRAVYNKVLGQLS